MESNPLSDIKIAIIGKEGEVGRWDTALCKSLGCKDVCGSDPKIPNGPSNREVAEGADIIITSVRPLIVESVIHEILSCLRPDQLLIDNSSVQGPAMRAMMQGPTECVSIHKMERPSPVLNLKGGNVVVSEGRLNRHREHVEFILEKIGATIVRSNPIDHDKAMAFVQGLMHATTIAHGMTARRLKRDMMKMFAFASPVYELMLAPLARMLAAQDPSLYAEILICNSEVPPVLKMFLENFSELLRLVEKEQLAAIVRLIDQNRVHHGMEAFHHGNRVFALAAEAVRTAKHPNTVRIVASENRKGTLYRITQLFDEAGVDLDKIMNLSGSGQAAFIVGFAEPRSSQNVMKALNKLEKTGLGKFYFS